VSLTADEAILIIRRHEAKGRNDKEMQTPDERTMQHEVLDVAMRSDPGMVRSHNEDAVFVDAELGLAILADGMGGYKAGEVASGMATTLLANSFSRLLVGPTADPELLRRPEQLIHDEICGTNAAIFNASQSEPQYSGMGTTLVFAWLLGQRLYLAHVGDSRAYRWRNQDLQRLTKDHSLLQEQIDSGTISLEEARYSANRNLVTRALGIEPEVEVDIAAHEFVEGDLLMLCSDGLNDMLSDDEIAEILDLHADCLVTAAECLIERANDAGGRDNVSVILVRMPGMGVATGSWWHRLLAKLK